MNEEVDAVDVAAVVGANLGSRPVEVTELDGGEVGRVRRVELADGRTAVLKTGETPLSVEASMLRYLADETDLPVPAVYAATDEFLLLEYVAGEDDAAVTPAVERDLAAHLASLHDVTAERFGFPFDTLSGPLTQRNPWTDSWVEFYRDQRLMPVADEARESGRLGLTDYERVGSLAADLPDLIDEPESPSLVHGDVWRGNLVLDGERIAAFLDPAVYYGHHEVELAYVDWTGVGGETFFEAYRRHRGVATGFFETRRDVYALYPVLEHVWYFGRSYHDDLDRLLSRLGY